MKIGFDVISDLNLGPDTPFDWEGKATSLYCIIAGNLSHDTKTIVSSLNHLARFYQGIFYVPGAIEYQDVVNIAARTKELVTICQRIRNVAILHQHVVIIDGIAVVGCNGWYGNTFPTDPITEEKIQHHRYEDIHYLKNSIEKLQKHLDVTHIVLVTNSVPNPDLYFKEVPTFVETQIPLNLTLLADTQKKISHWVFGTYGKIVDTVLNDINYVNNPCLNRNPYWAKRIDVEV